MFTSAMLRRLLIAVAALSISAFCAAEGFSIANTHARANSKTALSTASSWIRG